MTEVRIKDRSGHVLRSYDIGGYHVPTFYLPPKEIKKIVTAVPNFYFRKDDVMLCTFPKTGTNWVFEIMMMLLRGSSNRIETNKIQTMLECTPADMIDDLPSPRVINMHLSPRFLPNDLGSKQIKTILMVRNPKDTAVSYYNHMTGMNAYKYKGKWQDWLYPYIHGDLEYGKYSTYLREWDEILQSGVKFPLHIIYYEELTRKYASDEVETSRQNDNTTGVWKYQNVLVRGQNCLNETRRLAQFLNVKLSDNLIQEIVDKCSFDEMAKDKLQPIIKEILFSKDFHFFRKGKVGDWKNWFSAEQSQEYDEMWTKEMRGSNFKFVYDETDLKSKL